MLRIGRRIGIAVGSVVIAYLALSLVAGVFLGSAVASSPWMAVVTVVLGGLIYADIIRRDHRPAETS